MNSQIKISEILLDYFKLNNRQIMVSTYTRLNHIIFLSNDEKYLFSKKALGKNNFLYLSWFDGIVDFIRKNGGRVKKGNGHNSKVGYGKCTKDTLCGYIAINCYGHKIGESTFDPVFIVCAILENAGICKNERGYISLNLQFR